MNTDADGQPLVFPAVRMKNIKAASFPDEAAFCMESIRHCDESAWVADEAICS